MSTFILFVTCLILISGFLVYSIYKKKKPKNRNHRYYDEKLVKEAINSSVVEDMLNNTSTFVCENNILRIFKENNNEY